VKTLLGFLFKRSKKTLNNSLQKSRFFDSSQKKLNSFQTPPRESRLNTQAVSVGQLRDEVNENLKAFQSCVKAIKETSLKLEELNKILKSGEISENVYMLIMKELSERLLVSFEEMLNLRRMLELSRTRAKLEWAKDKKELEEMVSMLKEDASLKRDLYAPLYRWENIISDINKALSSLTIEEELSLIEQYLSLTKEFLNREAQSEEVKRSKMLCKQRLKSISERWTSIRRDKIEQVMNLELKSSKLKEDIKEVEVMFAVGELDQRTYESKMSVLQGMVKNVEKKISDIQRYIDEMDMKIFRCLELLREK